MQKELQNVIKIFTLAVMLLAVNVTWGQITEGFETGMPTSYTANGGGSATGPDVGTSTSLSSGTWLLNDVIRGTQKKSGTYGAQLRSATSSSITTPLITNGIGTVTFWAAGSTTSGGVQLQISTDGGASYTQVGSTYTPAQNTFNQYTATINNTGTNLKIRFYRTAGTIYIDDVNITANAAPSNAAPTASSVAISGTTAVGQTLTGSYTYADAESNPEGTSTFQWYRADNAAGTTNKTTIASATASTYTLVAADAGKYLSFAVVPKATAGTTTGTETYSAWLNIPAYTLTYNGNSNTGGTAPASASYLAGASVTLPGAATLVRTGYIFSGWNTLADGTGTSYAAGATYTMPASAATLYANWAVNTTPTIIPSPASLSGFTYVNNNGPSANQSFTLSGTSLTGAPGDITVTGSASYEVSLTAAGTYTSSVTIPYSSATLASTPVYVRLKAGLAPGTYNSETINISGGGATATVTVNGNVTNQAPTASSPVVSGSNYIVGTTLTGSFTYADYENDPQGTSTYKWYTATTSAGANATVISGATSTTFTLTSAQSGRYIQYSVTPVAASGTTTGVETKSGWYGPIVSPSVAVTPGTLTGFTYPQGAGPSASQSFSVSGSNLNGGNLTVTGSTNYEVSLTSAGTYTSSVTVPYSANTLSATPVYVRLKSGLTIGNYNNQSITVSGAGASNATVSASGTVTLGNDNCSGALVLTVGAAATSGTLSNATDSGLGASSCGGNPDDDVWYVFTTTIAGTYSITATPANTSSLSIDFVNQIFSGTCGNLTSVACKDFEASGGIEVLAATLAANTTYYVRLYDLYANSSPPVNSNFTVRVTAPVPAITTNPAAIAFGNQENGTSSAAQQFTLTAEALNPSSGNVTLTTAAPFQISQNGTSWGTTLSIAYSNYALTSTIQVRYSPTAYSASTGSVSISGGSATATVALTGTGVLGIPLTNAASDISPTTFNANWNAVTNATGYRLDVATSPVFNPVILSEDFSNFTSANGANSGVNYATANNSALFLTPGWTGRNIFYTSDADGAPRFGTGNSSTGTGALITPTIDLSGNGGVATFKFDVKRFGSDGAATLQVHHSANGTDAGFAQVGSNITVTANYVTYTYTITGGTASSKIRIQSTVGDQRFYIDNITVSYSNILPAYNNLTVNALTQAVSGLTENTNYYYRVRAVNTASNLTSANSNVIAVTTGKNLVWNGTQWTGNVTPTTVDDGTIAPGATYNTPSNLIIGSLTVSPTSTVNIPANRTITVARNLVNNAPAANFTVQDNGALVQTATGVATNNTPITVIKNSNPLYRFDYTLWSSPVAGQTMRLFSMGTSNNRFYEYKMEAGDEGYYPIENIFTTTFTAGKSYLIRMPNSIQSNVTGTTNGGTTTPAEYAAGAGNYIFEGKFTGTPYTGDITYNAATATSEYCATGNPYPSPINIAAFYAANAAIIDGSSAIYFWRKRNNTDTSSSSYASITLADFNFTPNTGSTGTGGQDNLAYYTGNSANWVLAPGQGFIVKTTGNITYNNAMRRAAPLEGGQGFFKSGASQVSRFRMKVTAPEGDAGQMSVVYMPQGTMGLDYSLDGKLLGDASLAIYTLAENTPLSIQARPEFDVTDVVPAGFTANTSGSFTIALSHTDGVFANGQKVYLKDKAEGIVRDMAQGDYTFTTEAGTFNDRFEIVYTTAALGVDTPVLDASTVIVYQNGSTININSGTAVINSVNVFDIRGRKLFSLDKVNASEAAIDNLTAAKQVLIVEINTDKGTVTKKIVF